MVRRVVEGGARGGEPGSVGGIRIAAPGQIVAARFRVGLDRHRLVLHIVGAEEIGQVEFGSGPGLYADRRAAKLLGRRDPKLFRDNEALSVIVIDADEGELQIDVAAEGPGGVARQHVNLARAQCGEAGLAGQAGVFDLCRIAQHGGGDGAAQIHIETSPDPLVVGCGKSRQAGVDAALKMAALFDVVQRGGVRYTGCEQHDRSGSAQ